MHTPQSRVTTTGPTASPAEARQALRSVIGQRITVTDAASSKRPATTPEATLIGVRTVRSYVRVGLQNGSRAQPFALLLRPDDLRIDHDARTVTAYPKVRGSIRRLAAKMRSG